MKDGAFWEAVRRLKQLKPCAYDVSVRIVKGFKDGTCADCTLNTMKDGRYFSIRIARNRPRQTQSQMMEALCHEWAHARCWNHRHDVEQEPDWHSAEWGVEYAACYRLVFEDE